MGAGSARMQKKRNCGTYTIITKTCGERMLELQALPNKVTEKFDRKQTFAEIDEKFKSDNAQMTLYDLFDFP